MHQTGFDLNNPNPPTAGPVRWHPVSFNDAMRRNDGWASDQVPGVVIRHCGHPTALRPYYIVGGAVIHRKFPNLDKAQRAAEATNGKDPKVRAEYVAGIGWMAVTPTGRHGNFDTADEALDRAIATYFLETR